MSYTHIADWIMLYTCNYNCSFCYTLDKVREKMRYEADTQKLIDFWNNTGFNWRLCLSGGEPFMFPNFVKLLEGLMVNHYFSIATNLSLNIDEFVDKINPDKILYLNCALHPETEQNEKRFKNYVKRVTALKNHGFQVVAGYVLHPDRYESFDRAKKILEDVDIELEAKFFKGKYNDTMYPKAYPEDIFNKYFSKNAKIEVLDVVRHMVPAEHTPTCNAGHTFVFVDPDGIIYNCQSKKYEVLGNLQDGYLHLRNGKITCHYHKSCCCANWLMQMNVIEGFEDTKKNKDSLISWSNVPCTN